MKLKSIKANCHELDLDNGVLVLFSYETPVAISLPGVIRVTNFDGVSLEYLGVIKTNQKFSKTTSAHINAWTATTKTLPHEEFLALVNAAISYR